MNDKGLSSVDDQPVTQKPAWDYDYERGYAIAIARNHDILAHAFGVVYANDFAHHLTPSNAFDQWVELAVRCLTTTKT